MVSRGRREDLRAVWSNTQDLWMVRNGPWIFKIDEAKEGLKRIMKMTLGRPYNAQKLKGTIFFSGIKWL